MVPNIIENGSSSRVILIWWEVKVRRFSSIIIVLRFIVVYIVNIAAGIEHSRRSFGEIYIMVNMVRDGRIFSKPQFEVLY